MSPHQNRSKRSPRADRNPTIAEIKQARADAGLTQEQAAKTIYLSVRAWEDYEQGITRMHPAFWELFQIKARKNAPSPRRKVAKIPVSKFTMHRVNPESETPPYIYSISIEDQNGTKTGSILQTPVCIRCEEGLATLSLWADYFEQTSEFFRKRADP